MEFRTQTATFLILLTAPLLRAQEFAYSARHHHLHKGGEGTLRLTTAGIGWSENVKKSEHSRSWRYAEIQRLELSPARIRIVSYEDSGWQFGRDREYVFDRLPKELALQVYPMLAATLDQRFIAHVADPNVTPLWETPAKLLLGRGGSNGKLKVAPDSVVFDGGEKGESRIWRIADIETVSSAGPFDLTLTTIEGEHRVQLKEALAENRYQELWRRVSEFHGLRLFGPTLAHHP